MPTIYTVGCQRLKLADLQSLVSAIKVDAILDWRSKPEGRLNPPTLERAFPGRYKNVGDKCNESKITDKALFALSQLQKSTLLLFHKESPGYCTRHEHLAVPMLERFSVDVTHVCGPDLISAKELQRSIDDDNDYAFTEWAASSAPTAAPAASTVPVNHPAPIETISDLADRAMLVNLHLYMLGLSRQNESLNNEIADKHGNDKAMTKVVESLLPKEAMATLSQLRSSIRQEFYRRTLPWQDGGTRILSTGGYMDFAEFMRKSKTQWDPAVQYFVDNWDSYVADARVKRNGLFRAEQYPTKEQVAKRFDFTWQVQPVPVADDFRAKVTADEAAVIRQQLEQSLKATVDASMGDIWKRLRGVLTNDQGTGLKDRLIATRDNPDRTFRDSIITNITNLLAIVPSLNLTGDPDVTRFCAEIQRELTTIEPATLREDPKVREDVINRADEILAKMQSFI
jgi:hypothetical protein